MARADRSGSVRNNEGSVCKQVNTHYSQAWENAKSTKARERDISLPRGGLPVACTSSLILI